MQMTRLEIYGYGKWIDQTFDLGEGIHVFYGMNEAGKSTLMSFIHSILFGFPTRNSTLLRYEPRESSRYGGKILGKDKRFGEVIIERIHGKVTGNVTVTLEDGTTGTDELLETVLNGLTRESFQNIFSFSLTDIEQVHQLNKNQLSRYLLNIGAHGTEYYLELADQLRADADKLYRPSGRVLDLNKQLTALEKQEKKLVHLEKKNANYLSLVEKLNNQKTELTKLEKHQKQKEKRVADIAELKKQWHVFDEINTLEEELKTIELPPLKQDGHTLLAEYKREKDNLNGQLQEVQIKINEAKQALEQAEMIEAYEKNKEDIIGLENKLPEMIETLRDYEEVAVKRAQIQKELLQIESHLEVVDQPMYPTPIEPEENEKAKAWQEKLLGIEQAKEKLNQDLKETNHELTLKNQTLDQYETLMWDIDEFKEVEQKLHTKETVKHHKVPGILSGLAGISLVLVAFFLQTPTQWFFLIGGVLAFLLSFVLLRKQTPEESNALLDKEYEKQVALKKAYERILAEVDAIQAKQQGMIQKQADQEKETAGIIYSWKQLLEDHHLPSHIPLNQAESIVSQVDALHQHVQADQTQAAKQADLKRLLEKETVIIGNILSFPEGTPFKEKITVFRQYLNQVKAEMTREQDKLDQLTALKQEEKQLKNQIENTQTKIKHLLETAGVKDEAAFLKLYQEKEKVENKQNRLRFLKENAPNYQAYQVLPSRDELAAKETSFHQELKELEKDKNRALREMTNTQVAIENLEKDGTFSEELQVFENEKARAQRLVDEWVSNQVAAWLLTETLSLVTRDRFMEIMADAESYFNLLTGGEYERIVFKDDALFVQLRSGQVVDVRVLSRGTAEPLYVAIRLAYIKNTMDILEIPVIMDDPFVNFDEERRLNMYRLLEKLGADLQMIYFTFDPLARDYYKEEEMTKLGVKI